MRAISRDSRRRKDFIGAYNAFWTSTLLLLLRVTPTWICLVAARPVALVFFCLAVDQRNAVISNLRTLNPGHGALRLWVSGLKVFTQFSLTYLDRLWCMHFGHKIRWRTEHAEDIENRLNSSGGLMLFTIHSGNYDIGAEYFSEAFQREIHIVRAPEETACMQRLRERELKAMQLRFPNVHVLHAGEDWSFGLNLCGILGKAGVVAVQGDRPFSGTTLTVDYEGVSFRLPRGPFVLARLARVPCYPIALYRVGCCEYTVLSGPPFSDGGSACELEIARAWLAWLIPTLLRRWDQWFVFERVIERSKPEVVSFAVCD